MKSKGEEGKGGEGRGEKYYLGKIQERIDDVINDPCVSVLCSLGYLMVLEGLAKRLSNKSVHIVELKEQTMMFPATKVGGVMLVGLAQFHLDHLHHQLSMNSTCRGYYRDLCCLLILTNL